MPGALTGAQKKASDLLVLESQMAVNHQIGLGIGPVFFIRAANALNCP